MGSSSRRLLYPSTHSSVGVLDLIERSPRPFPPDDLRFVVSVDRLSESVVIAANSDRRAALTGSMATSRGLGLVGCHGRRCRFSLSVISEYVGERNLEIHTQIAEMRDTPGRLCLHVGLFHSRLPLLEGMRDRLSLSATPLTNCAVPCWRPASIPTPPTARVIDARRTMLWRTGYLPALNDGAVSISFARAASLYSGRKRSCPRFSKP